MNQEGLKELMENSIDLIEAEILLTVALGFIGTGYSSNESELRLRNLITKFLNRREK